MMNADVLKKAAELRHELHKHPELSGQEVWTKQRLMRFVAENSNLEIHDREAYFYAVYRSPSAKRPGIAFRADFDALPMEDEIDAPYRSCIPGAAHKCGHDGHAACLCALAAELEELAPDRDVYLIFQHAEETGAGAKVCKAVLEENDICEVYGYHNQYGEPLGKILTRPNTINCASKGMSIRMIGEPTHASLPENGKNPVFALSNVVQAIPVIADKSRYKGLLLCTVVQFDLGEHAFGMAASDGVLRCTIRGEYEEELNRLQQQLEDCARAQAEEYGLRVEFTYEDEFPESFNHPASVEKVAEAARELGYPFEILAEPYKGSDDFGCYTKIKPGAYFFAGMGTDTPGHHTAAYDFNDGTIPYAVEMFKKLIVLQG